MTESQRIRKKRQEMEIYELDLNALFLAEFQEWTFIQ